KTPVASGDLPPSRLDPLNNCSIRSYLLLSALSVSCVSLLEEDFEGAGDGGEGEGAGDVGGGAEAGAAVELEGGVPAPIQRGHAGAHPADAAVGLRVLHVFQRVDRG